MTFIRWLTLALWILFVVMTLNAYIGAEVLNGDADLLVESAMGCKINKHLKYSEYSHAVHRLVIINKMIFQLINAILIG